VGVVVYCALQKKYFLSDFPVIAEKVSWKGGGDYLVRYLTKIQKNVGTLQFKLQVKKNITKYVVLYNIPRNI
jgi:hypothetical protein